MKRSRKLLANVGLTLLVTVACVLLSEFALRVFSPQSTFFPRFIESKEYALEFPKNADLIEETRGRWRFVYHTNEIGRRGAYRAVAEHYETANIVVLGDSFTFGYGVQDPEVYTEIMAQELGDDFFVINGGMGGWGIDSQIKWFYKVGRAYKPMCVVLQFCWNDPSDSHTGVTRIEDGTFRFEAYPHSKPWWQVMLSRSALIHKSHLYCALRKFQKRLERMMAERGAQQDAGDRVNRDEANYVDMLNLFVEELNAEGLTLIFVSVTHSHEDVYHYDVDHFPDLKRAVEELHAQGRLRWVNLPLERMRLYPGSLEGHEWAAVHHRLVGESIAAEILHLERNGNAATGPDPGTASP